MPQPGRMSGRTTCQPARPSVAVFARQPSPRTSSIHSCLHHPLQHLRPALVAPSLSQALHFPHPRPALQCCCRRRPQQPHLRAAGSSGGSTSSSSSGSRASSSNSTTSGGPPSVEDLEDDYDLRATKAMVETAMLAAVSGLGYLLATTVKLENSLGYFLPLPVVIAAMRSGKRAGLDTALATLSLLLVMVGPLKAIAYFLMHGIMASTLGALWRARVPWLVSVPLGAFARMAGQATYLCLSSVTMNENLLAVVLANVHSFLDQMSASMGMSGAPSPMTVACILFAMFLINGLCYVFLIHVIYRMALQSMGFQLGPLPKLVHKYLYGGTVRPEEPPSNYQRSISATN